MHCMIAASREMSDEPHILLRNEPEGVGRVCFLLRKNSRQKDCKQKKCK